MPLKAKKKGVSKKKGKSSTKKGGKFDVAVEKYLGIPGKYRELLRGANAWFEEHNEELIKLLKLHVSYSSEETTYDDFEAALVSMNFPFTKLEIRIVYRLFDHDHDGMIKFEDLKTHLSYISLQDEEQTKIRCRTEIKSSPQWILARFYCLNCLEISEHQYHFSRIISVNTYPEGLANIIRNNTGLCTPKIAIFLSSDAEDSTQLQPETLLLDQGLQGGGEWSPMEVGFYYKPVVENQLSYSMTDSFGFKASVHDPILWSKMTLELAKYEARLPRGARLSEVPYP